MKYAEDDVPPSMKDDRGIRLGDQLEEADRMIALLFETVQGLEGRLSPILRPMYETDGGTEPEDVTPNLSPLQQQVMGQYNALNRLGNHINEISRRVQL